MEKETIKKLLTDEISQAKQEAERLRAARTNNHALDGGEDGAVELAEKLKLAEEELVQVSTYICLLSQVKLQYLQR